MNGRSFSTVAILGAVLGSPAASPAAAPDKTGAGPVEWASDPWTWPWVQVAGSTLLLSPRSYATLEVLPSAAEDLERERAARDLVAEQDTVLVVQLHVRVLDAPGAEGLAWLSPDVEVTLQDDLGRRWTPVQVNRGPVVPAGVKPPRFLDDLGWLRGPVDVIKGKELMVGEHRLRFVRRDKAMGGPAIHARTKWFLLRVSYAGNEWVSNCVFRLPSAAGGRDASRRR
jgi:hypothetical protein